MNELSLLKIKPWKNQFCTNQLKRLPRLILPSIIKQVQERDLLNDDEIVYLQ